MALPMYAEIGSKKTFRAPYRAQNIRFTGFLLDAEASSLASLCAGALTGPSGGAVDYRPALPFALLSFTSIGRLDAAERLVSLLLDDSEKPGIPADPEECRTVFRSIFDEERGTLTTIQDLIREIQQRESLQPGAGARP